MALSHTQFVLPLQGKQVTALENQVDEDEGHVKCKACKTCKTMSGICKVTFSISCPHDLRFEIHIFRRPRLGSGASGCSDGLSEGQAS